MLGQHADRLLMTSPFTEGVPSAVWSSWEGFFSPPTRNCMRSRRHSFIYMWGFINTTSKMSALTLSYYIYTFLSTGPSFQPCSTPLIKRPRACSVMPLSSFGDKDEPLGNFQLITTQFSGHRWSYSKRNCIGSIIQLVSAFRMSVIRYGCCVNVSRRIASRLLLVLYSVRALRSNAALWLIYLKYDFNMDTFVTKPFTVPQHWSDMWEQIPLCNDIKTVDHCSVQTRDTGTTQPNWLICMRRLFKS